MTNYHLNIHEPGYYFHITRRKKFRVVIAPLFAKPKGRVVESALGLKWIKYLKNDYNNYQIMFWTGQTVGLLDCAEGSVGHDGEEK